MMKSFARGKLACKGQYLEREAIWECTHAIWCGLIIRIKWISAEVHFVIAESVGIFNRLSIIIQYKNILHSVLSVTACLLKNEPTSCTTRFCLNAWMHGGAGKPSVNSASVFIDGSCGTDPKPERACHEQGELLRNQKGGPNRLPVRLHRMTCGKKWKANRAW